MDFSPYPSYTIYDINKDGIPELIYNDGMYEAARQFHVYTYQNGKVVFVGSHSAYDNASDDMKKKHKDGLKTFNLLDAELNM
jgi:hypothetical protein